MKVAVTRSGGFAGLVRHAEIDSADDPAVARLVDEVRLDEVPQHATPPDRFVYHVRIGDRTVQVGESDLDGPLRALVRYTLTHGS